MMEFNEIVECCGQALMIYFAFKCVMWLLGLGQAFDQYRETNEQVQEYLKSIVHAVKSEKHGDTMYFFDADTDAFIAQGKTYEEIALALKARWRDHIFLIAEKYVLAGPDFKLLEIKDPEAVGKMLADRVVKKIQ
jgi:hypothetical protein